MEPIPETVRAIEELGPFADGGTCSNGSWRQGRRISALVPDCIALTLASSEHAVTFALLVSRRQLGLLAALQASGPRRAPARRPGTRRASRRPAGRGGLAPARAVARRALRGHHPDPGGARARRPWRVESRCTAPRASAFDGHHGQLSEILGATPAGAVTNADLPFRALAEAEEAPERLRRAGTLDEAMRIVGLLQQLAPEAARQRIRDAAARAGISEEQLAEAVIRLRRP